MNFRFLSCKKCNAMVGVIKACNCKNCGIMCCGQPMEELVPNTVDASNEKHIPVYTVNKNLVEVTVGSTIHPMDEDHYIEWVSLQTKQGNQRKQLAPGQSPKVCFCICDGDQVEAVYAYCNKHGLWKA